MSETETDIDNFEVGIATLSADATDEFDSSAPWKVSGVAIPVNTVVNGGQNVDHFFPAEVLEGAVGLLEGAPIVKNFHELSGQASADDVIGEITSDGFQKGIGLVFEGEITDKDIAEKISQGYLDVSPTPARSLGEFDESMGAQRVDRLVDFRDIAVVANGQPGAKVEMGGNAAVTALGRDVLSRGFDVLESKQDTLKDVAGVSFTGTADGKLDESEIPTEGFESHYLYPRETKSESSYAVVDADGNLRKGNVDSAWKLGARGGVDPERHDERLMELAAEFDSPPEWAQEQDTNEAAESVSDSGSKSGLQSDDGGQEDNPQSSAATNEETMTDKDTLSDEETAILAAADGVENVTDVLSDYKAAEQPAIVEQDALNAKDEQIEELAGVFRDALSEQTGLASETVAAMPVDALCNEFRNGEGEIESETLSQSPETGTGSEPETPTDTQTETLSAEEKETIRSNLERADLLKNRTPDHADTLRSEAAELAGVEDADDIEVDNL